MGSLIAIPLLIIVASYFEIYKVKHITVTYQDDFGRVKAYAFDYAYPMKENWMDIQSFENYIADRKNLPQVKIMQMKVKTEWKLRRV